jgi:D-3-phosphoglycerate dehydrogenase / 2-oxoglutarate reductase
MDLLIVEPLEDEVMQWLAARHPLCYAPELALDPRAFRQSLYNVRAAIVPPSVPVDAQTLHYAPLLRAIGRVSAGAENIDADACARAGVEVVRSANATAQAEAEFMLGALLSLLRRVPVLGADGMWVGRELGAATVGLIGMPPAARAMAQMLGGFGSQLVGYDPALHASDSLWTRWRVMPLGLRELLEHADAVCIQLSYFSRYHGLLGDRFLPHCKPNQVIVCLTQSGIFDEAALATTMRSGRIAAAWLDSLEPGALEEGRPLAGIDTLQITPRVASTTRESRLRSAWGVARRIDELLSRAPSPRQFRASAPGVPLDLAAGPASP